MAKRKQTHTPNIEPAVLTLLFATPVTSADSESNHYIDLSQVASIINRRMYRQGLNWAVSGFKLMTGSGEGSVMISKCPNTWMLANSWVKGFENWRERIQTAIGEGVEESETKGKFLDFKIYADETHHSRGYASNLLPLGLVGNTPTVGSWLPSKVTLQNGGTVGQYEIVAVGANYPGVSAVTGYDAVSLIEGYSNSRRLPNIRDPNNPDDLEDVAGLTPENWMRGMHTSGVGQADETIIGQVTGYDLPPYPFENDGTHTDTMYPGGASQLPTLEVHDMVTYTSSSIGAQSYAKGGNFPCGLIRIDHRVPAESIAHNLVIQIDLMPGNHRGYLAEPMGDM